MQWHDVCLTALAVQHASAGQPTQHSIQRHAVCIAALTMQQHEACTIRCSTLSKSMMCVWHHHQCSNPDFLHIMKKTNSMFLMSATLMRSTAESSTTQPELWWCHDFKRAPCNDSFSFSSHVTVQCTALPVNACTVCG